MFMLAGVVMYFIAKLIRMNKKIDFYTKLKWIDFFCCFAVLGFCVEFMIFWISIINKI
jgi:hypothetical protein